MEQKLLQNFNTLDILLSNINIPLYEEEKGVTYYELRVFLTMLYRQINDETTKKVLGNILKTLAVMEIRKIPIPTVKKLKGSSPIIFGEI